MDKYVIFGADRVYNDTQYIIDTNKISQLGWEPKVHWEEGISQTSK